MAVLLNLEYVDRAPPLASVNPTRSLPYFVPKPKAIYRR